MQDEKISVIVPFQGAPRLRYLIRTLESLCLQLTPRDQVIVVEQAGPADECVAKETCSVRGMTHERLVVSGKLNIGACLNRGVNASWNQLHLVCNADSIKHPRFLDRARHRIGKTAERTALVGMAGRLGQVPSEELLTLGGSHPRAPNLVEWDALWGFVTPSPDEWQDTLVFRKREWRAIGRFYEHFEGPGPVGEDFVWRLRFAARVIRDPEMKSIHIHHRPSVRIKADQETNAVVLAERKRALFFKRALGTCDKKTTAKIRDLAGVKE